MDSEYFCYSWANAMTPREIVFHRKNVEILLKSTSVTICNTNNQEPFDSLDSIFFFKLTLAQYWTPKGVQISA